MSSSPEHVVGGRYELLEEIGRGGSATVHRARDVHENRWVAVKVVPVSGTDDAHRRWRHEAEVVSSLRHPALVAVLDQEVDDDRAVLVMELLPDGSLRDRLRLGPLAPAVVATVGADVAGALAHIHGRGVVHRDVKPANVLLQVGSGDEVRGKLTDFGIAKLLESATTTTTTVVGTALYLSPEQAQGHAVGTPSDVYSLGLTLLEALTGRPAFPGTIAESLTARLLRDPSVPSGFGYGWRSLISAMTARDPLQRPAAAEVAERLLAIVDDESVADTVELRAVSDTATRPLQAAVGRRGRRPVRIGLAAAVLTAGLCASGTVMAATPAFAPAAQQAAAATTVRQPSASPTATATAPRSESRTASSTASSASSGVAAVSAVRSSGAASSGRTSATKAEKPSRTEAPKRGAPAPSAPRPAKRHGPAVKPHGPAAKAPGGGHGPGPGNGHGPGKPGR